MISLEEQFKYHPPLTEERKLAHDEVNKATLRCAETLIWRIEDDAWKQKVIDALQQARMLANQAITFQELEKV